MEKFGPTLNDFSDEKDVCNHCTSGVCCTTEGVISLAAWDVMRLAAYFNLSVKDFMEKYTQDYFINEDGEKEKPDYGKTVVTYLRRRTNHISSPCLFLKYEDVDGVTTSRCSVHPARAVACREFTWDTCKHRFAGELASLIVRPEVREKISIMKNNGGISGDSINSQVLKLVDLAHSRMDNYTVFNTAHNNIDVRDYQDPIDVKMNRLLSMQYLQYGADEGDNEDYYVTYTMGDKGIVESEVTRLEQLVSAAVKQVPNYVDPEPFHDLNGGWIEDIIPVQNYEQNSDEWINSIENELPLCGNNIAKATNYLLRILQAFEWRKTCIEDSYMLWEQDFLSLFLNSTTMNPRINGPVTRKHQDKLLDKVMVDLRKEMSLPDKDEESTVRMALIIAHSDVPKEIAEECRKILKECNPNFGHIFLKNPIEVCFEKGYYFSAPYKESGFDDTSDAWETWYSMILDARYHYEHASIFSKIDDSDLNKLLLTHLRNLKNLLDKGIDHLAIDMLNILTHIGYAAHFYYRRPVHSSLILPLTNLTRRIMKLIDDQNLFDLELCAEIIDGIYVPVMEQGYAMNKEDQKIYNRIVWEIQSKQDATGGWVNMIPVNYNSDQSEFLYEQYHTTFTCLDALSSHVSTCS